MDLSATASFEFTEEDYNRIILQDSLFNSNLTHDMASTSIKQLQKLEERETRLFLHAVTLCDYMRAKRIPRGLRVNKGPIIGKEKTTFCDQWTAILNKCSFDLMALTIQEVSTTLAIVREEISEVKTKLKTEVSDPACFKQCMEECQQLKQKLSVEITASKKRKFERDALDYERGRVYPWRNPKVTSWPKPRPRHLQQHSQDRQQPYPPTTDCEYESESSNFSQASGPFLAEKKKTKPPRQVRMRGGRKGADGR